VLLVGLEEVLVRLIHQGHLLEVLELVGKGMRVEVLIMLLPSPMVVVVAAQGPLGLITPLVGLEMAARAQHQLFLALLLLMLAVAVEALSILLPVLVELVGVATAAHNQVQLVHRGLQIQAVVVAVQVLLLMYRPVQAALAL
jgi:hypothetical protein